MINITSALAATCMVLPPPLTGFLLLNDINESPQDDSLMAAIDMGSNSFHMVVARLSSGEIRPVQKIVEKVMLASGLGADNTLDEAAFQRGVECLRRFAQCLEGIDPHRVRCVGTNTLRKARNGEAFLREARKVLRCPIEVVAGREEARLIYLGVSHSLQNETGNRLVFDIGGGSTEFIIGRGFEPLLTESLHMGCVAYRDRFFADGKVTAAAFQRAVIRTRVEISSIEQEYKAASWQDAVGSSGTVKAVKSALIEQGWYDDGITLDGLYRLRDLLLTFPTLDKIDVAGIKADRRTVAPAGLAILIGIFEQLGVTSARFSDGAMREGVLYDLLGRDQPEDVRERTIRSLMARSGVDLQHAERVRNSAEELFEVACIPWDLGEFCHSWLVWAALCHEVGLTVSHSGFHKHGAYLLQHSDLPGFTRQDQFIMATLVLNHRRKLRQPDDGSVPAHLREKVLQLSILLRLAVLMNRSRRDRLIEGAALSVAGNQLSVSFEAGWSDRYPLLHAELLQEQATLEKVGYTLELVTREAY